MSHQPQVFSSNGKLLLTGEYLVLRGANALALPVNLGQTLEIETFEGSGHPHMSWFAFAPGKQWFKTTFELPELDIIATDDRPKSAKLQLILLTLKQLKPELFDGTNSYKVITRLGFEPEWGLGSSSTLIANLAKWAKNDPYTLLNFSIGGSGYDIACANAESPLFYRLNLLRPEVKKASFKPVFADKLFFVYRGQKKDSSQGISNFNELTEGQDLSQLIEKVSAISLEAAQTENFDVFCNLMNSHEALLSGILLQPVLKHYYPDFDGHLKSLGAWGGDFMLAMTNAGKDYVTDYFSAHGLNTVFEYHALIK
jgi:mevalonate kinase